MANYNLFNLLSTELEQYDLESKNLNGLVVALSESTPANIPKKMSILLAVSELMLFTSQFRINIKHWNNSSIPVNNISFLLAESGASKDSSVRNIRKCFEPSYELIEKQRLQEAEALAIKLATDDNAKNPTQMSTWKKYYKRCSPLFASISTTEGFTQHLNDLSELALGSGFIYTGECGTELQTSPYFSDNIKLLSEVYDMGNKEVKIIKDRTSQSSEIKGFPVSSLMVGSQDNIIFDEANKKKFKLEFNTKLARRTNIVFVKEAISQPEFDSIQELLKYQEELEENAFSKRDKIASFLANDITPDLIKFNQRNSEITIEPEARELITLYEKYNTACSDMVDDRFPMTKKSIKHMYWRALKLAGALALSKAVVSIDKDIYIEAIRIVEFLKDDMYLLEQELDKETYETFVDYVKSLCSRNKTNKCEVTLHELKKLNYIKSQGNTVQKVKDLIQLATSCDNDGIYTLSKTEDKVSYEQLERGSLCNISYVKFKPEDSKEKRKYNCEKGYKSIQVEFKELEELLKGDYAFSSFVFANGIRGLDNIISGTKIIIFDIDKKQLSDEELHFILSDVNHYIVRSSDKNNSYKYRLIVELDVEVTLTRHQWKYLIKAVANHLCVQIDELPQSQIFFSYSSSADSLLKTTDTKPLAIKDFLQDAIDNSQKKERELTKKERDSALDDKLITFESAYEAQTGSRSKEIIKALYKAKFLGADEKYLTELAIDINNYITYPIEEKRFENTILNQIPRISSN